MNVIIIDDQKDVVNSLKNGINWSGLNIDEVYTACSAKDARKLFGEFPIEIMLSDIEMPEEDGLSLLRWVRENYSDVECILLTSYANFDYAKEAIMLDCYDYILQPARFEEVEAAVRKAGLKLKQKQKMLRLQRTQDFLLSQREMVLDSIIEKIFASEEARVDELFQELTDMFQKKFNKECYYLADIQILRWKKDEEEWNGELVKLVLRNILEEIYRQNSCEFLISQIGNYDYFILFYGEGDSFTYETLLNGIRPAHDFILKNMEFEAAVYMGNRVQGNLYRSVQRLTEIKENNIMRLPEIFEETYGGTDRGKSLDSLNISRWMKRIDGGEGVLVKNAVSIFLKEAQKEKSIHIDMMKTIHYEFSKAVFSILEKRQLNSQSIFTAEYSYEKYINAYRTYDTLTEAMEYCLLRLKNIPEEQTEADPVKLALKYIGDNMNKNISRSEVAKHVYLNEEYFSRIFKSRTGFAFKDYVTEVKMKYVKELLVTTNFSISIIASKVGYDNFSYFSKLFKKLENMTPQEYRTFHKTT